MILISYIRFLLTVLYVRDGLPLVPGILQRVSRKIPGMKKELKYPS
jgi:hypothetical protein